MEVTEHSGDNEFVIQFAEAAIREFCLSWSQNERHRKVIFYTLYSPTCRTQKQADPDNHISQAG